MQQRPDLIALLAAVERFLREELPAAVSDERLRFRVLVASSLVGQAAAELGAEDTLVADEIDKLRALLRPPDRPRADRDRGRQAMRAELAALDAELAARIRRGELADADARRHLLETLAAFLAVSSPRFDRRLDVEEPA